jgi:hypothetical protein
VTGGWHYPVEDWLVGESALRSDAGSGTRPSHCPADASVTNSRSGLGKTFGGTKKQRTPEPYPVTRSMDPTDPMARLDIGRVSDLAGANVLVGAESHD